MTTSQALSMRRFTPGILAKFLFCFTLGAFTFYVVPFVAAKWNSRRVPTYDKLSSNEDIQGRKTVNRQLKFHAANGFYKHRGGSVWDNNEQAVPGITSLKYDGHDFLQDPKFTFDKRFKNPCWYEGDTLKCLPYFFVIGVKKCGTSSMFWRILRLSEVVKPTGFKKEAQFFARGRFEDNDNDDIGVYVEMFTQAAKIIQKKSDLEYFKINKINPFITGEGSPSNLHFNSHWMNLPGNENLTEPKYVILDYIKHFLPDAKIIITFRDPIKRLYSDYYHEVKRMLGSFVAGPEHFHDIVVDGLRMYRNCFSKRTVRSCVYDPTYYDKTKMQMQLGIYYIFWEELLRVFPRDQILVLQNQDLSSTDTYLKIQTFLGLDPLPVSDLERIATAQYRKRDYSTRQMLNETLALLYEFYRPFNEKMAALMRDDTFLYKHDLM